MIRTNAILPKQLYADIQRLVEKAGKKPGDVLRDLVQRGLKARRQDIAPVTSVASAAPARRSLLDLANLHIAGGPKDLSTKADHYLYGED